MHEPLYSQALRHSWHLVWRNKTLWFFGLFAAVLGQMGLLEFLTQADLSTARSGLLDGSTSQSVMVTIRAATTSLPIDGWIWILCVFAIALGFLIVTTFVAVVSQGVLIETTAQSVKKDKAPHIPQAWRAGVRRFWPLFGLNAMRKGIIVLLTMGLGWGSWNAVYSANAADTALFFILFLLAVMVGIIISFLTIYIAGYIMVEDYPLLDACEAAWRLFLDHWLVSFEVAALILILEVAVAFLALTGLLVFFFPAVLLWFFAVITSNFALLLTGFILGAILFTCWLVFLGSVFTVFTTSVWTFLFMKMHRQGIGSRLVHWLSYKKSKE